MRLRQFNYQQFNQVPVGKVLGCLAYFVDEHLNLVFGQVKG
jgi:hypothetical protein